MNRIVPVILSGGAGTRLWPMSTPKMPKQFLPLIGDHSLFYETLARVCDRTRFTAPMIVCGAGHVEHVRSDLVRAGIDDATIIVEPAPRNTAPAIALAACAAPTADALLLVMPSDHVMTKCRAFYDAVDAAKPVAANGALVTFGITPTHAETGYGYVRRGEPLSGHDGVNRVAQFVEKPILADAEAMIAAGGHYWNAGIFMMRADRFLEELATQAPDMAMACRLATGNGRRDAALCYPDSAAFAACPSNSIDYAVMEKAGDVVVVPVNPGWSDVGSWNALQDIAAQDDDGNSISGNVVAVDVHRSLIRADAGTRVALLGVSDLIVVAHGDTILILPRDRAQEVKTLIDRLPR